MKASTRSLGILALALLLAAGVAGAAWAEDCCSKGARPGGCTLVKKTADAESWTADPSGAWLGIRMQEITPGLREALDLKNGNGVLVSDVVEDSPAEKAGIKPGDVIVKIDDREVSDPGVLAKYVGSHDPGDVVRVQFLRDGKKKTEEVKLGEREMAEPKVIRMGKDKPFVNAFRVLGGPRLGVIVQPLDEDLASYFDVKKDDGVLVVRVVEDSPASEAGIRGGDVITGVAGKEVRDAEDIREAIHDMDAGDEVAVAIVRKGAKKEITVTLDKESGTWLSDYPGLEGLDKLPQMQGMDRYLMRMEDSKDLEKEVDRLRDEVRQLRDEVRDLKQSRS
jgi:predicted metalloprotease with PDZ domain